jgi:hypothetical protein
MSDSFVLREPKNIYYKKNDNEIYNIRKVYRKGSANLGPDGTTDFAFEVYGDYYRLRQFNISFRVGYMGNPWHEYLIDWGDGTTEWWNIMGLMNNLMYRDHTYPRRDYWTITIRDYKRGGFYFGDSPYNITRVFNAIPRQRPEVNNNVSPTVYIRRSFNNLFAGQNQLISIPDDIFDNNIVVLNAQVRLSTGALGYADVALADVSRCFLNCSSLREIPEDLFGNAPGILEDSTREIFEGILGIRNFSECFSGCASLEYLPPKLFNTSIEANNFSGTFRNCTNMKGDPIPLWNMFPHLTGSQTAGCYANCTSLNGWPASIPSSWR